jgi:hypothetical protein
VDTRVYGVQVRHVPELSSWYGAAHVADAMLGDGVLDNASAEIGGRWYTLGGKFERTDGGAIAREASSTAILDGSRRVGVVHCVVEVPESDGGEFGLVWRADRAGNCLRLLIRRGICRVVRESDGTTTEVATTAAASIHPGANSVQVIDHGGAATFAINGRTVFDDPVVLPASDEFTGVGICTIGETEARFRYFEAHPSEVDLGAILDLPTPWCELGESSVVRHDLSGPEGLDLDGQLIDGGPKCWRREYGNGRIVTRGSAGAIVDGSVDRTNPGSMAYTIDWDDPDFADIAVDITPPGGGSGESEAGRGGLILWQDERNFLTITSFVDDSYEGASIAIFSHLDGFEEIYDAVWSMVSTKIYYGETHRLRVVCDGMRLMIFIDDEPVLYRALTDIYPDRGALSLRRVGLAVNWEWGDDTGSRFNNFVARQREGGTP